MTSTRRRASRFTYLDHEIDEPAGVVRCHYDLDGRRFTETVTVGAGRTWDDRAREAARLVHLLAGVSYYKAGAPPVLDLGGTTVRPGERDALRLFYVEGLGEFAYENDLDLTDLAVRGGVDAAAVEPPSEPVDPTDRPLVPFGGGLDSIVTVELLRPHVSNPALFVAERPGVRFAAIEKAAAAVGWPVLRAERELDGQLLRPTDDDRSRWFNGHVPVTGVLSAIAVLTAALDGRSSVVMSNEWSASSGNVVVGQRVVNHQFSKSENWEAAFRGMLAGAVPTVEWFSLLRPWSELWIAERFAGLEQYVRVFHSCNRAFALDPAKRLDRWCGDCDKCAFIDLILAPFLARAELQAVFDGDEPLENPTQTDRIRRLLGTVDDPKPFECVGDVDECRAALVLASDRFDRAPSTDPILHQLIGELGQREVEAIRLGLPRLLTPLGRHHVPDALLAAAHLR